MKQETKEQPNIRTAKPDRMTRGKGPLGNDGLARETLSNWINDMKTGNPYEELEAIERARSANALTKKSENNLTVPEEFMTTFDNLMGKLADSPAAQHPDLISPLAEFIVITEAEYTPSNEVQQGIREQVESRIAHTIIRQGDETAGKDEPIDTLENACKWGIIASHLGIPYDLNPKQLDDHPLTTDTLNRDFSYILNFELHHFDYGDGLKYLYFESLLPLDIIYFAQLNGFAETLQRRVIGELDERCKVPEIRQATENEARQRLAELKKEAGHPVDRKISEIYKELEEEYNKNQNQDGSSPYEFSDFWGDHGEDSIETLEDLLDEDPDKTKGTYFVWKDSNGVQLVYPRLTPLLVDSNTPRQAHSTNQVRKYLGPDLEAALVKHCEEKIYEKITEIIYRRNRVKDFLGGDIQIPRELAKHDDTELSTMDPEGIKTWVKNMVANWGPNDMCSELVLPSNLTPKEYKMYRSIKKAMEYVRRGELTYDTEDKRKLLPKSGDSISALPRLLTDYQID